MKRWLLMVGFLLVTVMSVEAQTPAETRPMPAQIFAPGVEVMSETLVPLPTPQPTIEGFPVSIFEQPTLSPDALPSLPSGYQWSEMPPTASPDGRWLVGLASVEGNPALVHAMAYDQRNEAIRDLGLVSEGETRGWGEWYEDQVLLQTATTSLHASTQWVYILDMQGEKQEIGPVSAPSQLLDVDPPELKVFWVEGEDEQPTCRLSTYDMTTGRVSEQVYGPYCFLEFQSKGVANYYRVVSPDRKLAVVARFDPETGVHTDLYSGEVEHIFWVSQDERYAALALDTSGMVDVLPGAGAFSSRYGLTQLTIVDLTNGQALYNMTATFDNVIGFWSVDVFEIEDNWLWVSTESDSSVGPNRFIRVADGQAETDLVDGDLGMKLGGGWYVITPGHLSYQWVKLHNLNTRETVDVVDVSAFPQYTVGVNSAEGNTFEMIVQCCSTAPGYFQLEYEAHYSIRLASVDTGAE